MELTKLNPGIILVIVAVLLVIVAMPGGALTVTSLLGKRKKVETSKWTWLTRIAIVLIASLLLASGLWLLIVESAYTGSIATPMPPSVTKSPSPTITYAKTAVQRPPTATVEPTSSPSNCEKTIRSTIEKANDAQSKVIEGGLKGEVLVDTWGEMGFRAKYQAERILADRRIVQIVDVQYQYTSFKCTIIQLPESVTVETEEQWSYDALLNCPDSPTPRRSTRIDHYHELYTLTTRRGVLQIHDWMMSREQRTEPWCD